MENRYLYKINDLAKFLGHNRSTVWCWIHSGVLSGCYMKIGSSYVFDTAKITDKLIVK